MRNSKGPIITSVIYRLHDPMPISDRMGDVSECQLAPGMLERTESQMHHGIANNRGILSIFSIKNLALPIAFNWYRWKTANGINIAQGKISGASFTKTA